MLGGGSMAQLIPKPPTLEKRVRVKSSIEKGDIGGIIAESGLRGHQVASSVLT